MKSNVKLKYLLLQNSRKLKMKLKLKKRMRTAKQKTRKNQKPKKKKEPKPKRTAIPKGMDPDSIERTVTRLRSAVSIMVAPSMKTPSPRGTMRRVCWSWHLRHPSTTVAWSASGC